MVHRLLCIKLQKRNKIMSYSGSNIPKEKDKKPIYSRKNYKISIIVSESVLRLVALPAVILKLVLLTSDKAAFTMPYAASCLYVKSTLLFPLCNVIVSFFMAF